VRNASKKRLQMPPLAPELVPTCSHRSCLRELGALSRMPKAVYSEWNVPAKPGKEFITPIPSSTICAALERTNFTSMS
jgi:hypothetical protein